jgi:integrase
MPRSYTEFYKNKRKYLSEQVEQGIVSESDAEAIRELADAFDEDKPTVTKPNWPDAQSNLTQYREDSTLANWIYHLTTYARHIELLDTTATEVNELAQKFIGEGTEHKQGGMKKGSVRAYQNTIRIFYRYWDDVGIDIQDITVFDPEDTSVNPRDMLDGEEIEELRNTPEHPRDSCIIDLLLYTGMRNRALRTLRIKDVDPDEGVFYFNTDENGLKNLHKPTAPRPLLGAVASVREWLDYHPAADDPDAFLIMGKPKYGNPDPREPVSDRTIQRVLDAAKEETSIDKPLNPHALRHNMVSLSKKTYDLDDATVKFLIGHTPDSTVMETTYSHISAEDYRKKAERKMGIREDEPESPMTPDYCDVCNEPLPANAKACSRCGTVYTPDAKSAEEQIQSDMKDSYREADPEDSDTMQKIDQLDDLLEDPDVKAALLEKLAEE